MSGVLRRWRLWLVLGVLLLLLIPNIALAQDLDAESQKCLQCHGNSEFSTEKNGEKISLYVDAEMYKDSIHGTNSCVICHPQEKTFPHQEVVYGQQLNEKVLKSCEACHQEPTKQFLTGSHAKEGPFCTDCHGKEHDIKAISGEVTNKKQSVEQCISCHEGKVVKSYEESFHGKAVNLGSKRAASCIDCHGAHNAMGAGDPNSPVSKQNVGDTCAKCHGKSASGFALGKEHFDLTANGDGKPMYFTYKFFTWLTILVISLLIIHIEMELFRKFRDSNNQRKGVK